MSYQEPRYEARIASAEEPEDDVVLRVHRLEMAEVGLVMLLAGLKVVARAGVDAVQALQA